MWTLIHIESTRPSLVLYHYAIDKTLVKESPRIFYVDSQTDVNKNDVESLKHIISVINVIRDYVNWK